MFGTYGTDKNPRSFTHPPLQNPLRSVCQFSIFLKRIQKLIIQCLKYLLKLRSLPIQSTVNSQLSTSVISNNRLSRRENLVLNTETSNQVAKYCGKEKKLLLGSNFFPFPQYFQYIFLIKRLKLHSHLLILVVHIVFSSILQV